jgi:hypothetical protein
LQRNIIEVYQLSGVLGVISKPWEDTLKVSDSEYRKMPGSAVGSSRQIVNHQRKVIMLYEEVREVLTIDGSQYGGGIAAEKRVDLTWI